MGAMGELVVGLVGLAVLAGVLVLLMRLAARVRRRGVGDAVLGPAEEIWHPNAREYRFVIRAQAERKVPIPSPGDRPAPRRRTR